MHCQENKCKRCGQCCLTINGVFQTCINEDVAMWKAKGRCDILELVDSISIGHGRYIHDIWVNPRTGDYFFRCPWLEKLSKQDKYVCQIHDVKPEHCRNYPKSQKTAKNNNRSIIENQF